MSIDIPDHLSDEFFSFLELALCGINSDSLKELSPKEQEFLAWVDKILYPD